MINTNKEYAYLSIDQLRQTFNPRMSIDRTGLSEYFNIKFDSSAPLRESKKQKGFAKIFNQEQNREIQSTSIFAKFKDSEQRRLYYSSNPRTKKLNTEKMLENITKILEKEQSFKKTNLGTFGRQKKEIRLMMSDCQPSLEKGLRKSLQKAELQQNQGKCKCLFSEKGKKHLFQHMLKKCEKLKEINRYEHELINSKQFKDQHLGIRFHTEPLGMLQKAEKNDISPNSKKPVFKSLFKPKFNDFSQSVELLDSARNKQSLSIRKYKNESVLKQRLKYLIKKSLMKNQNQHQRFLREERWFDKKRQMKRKTCQNQEKLEFGPWDEENEHFQIQFK